MTTSTNNIDLLYNNWDDTPVSNIRTRGTYPNVQRPNCPRPRHIYFQTINQHKPYGWSTMCYDIFDDRPDWFHFHVMKKHHRCEDPNCQCECHHHPHHRPCDDDEMGEFIEI